VKCVLQDRPIRQDRDARISSSARRLILQQGRIHLRRLNFVPAISLAGARRTIHSRQYCGVMIDRIGEQCRCLQHILGVGPMVATTTVSAIGAAQHSAEDGSLAGPESNHQNLRCSLLLFQALTRDILRHTLPVPIKGIFDKKHGFPKLIPPWRRSGS
jgi:hypothetical protein